MKGHLLAPALLAAGALLAAPAVAAAAAPPSAVVTAPAQVRFGDAFLLRATVRVPGAAGATVRAFLDPTPFSPLAAATVHQRSESGAAVLDVVQRVACLSAGCVPDAPKLRLVRAGRVSVRVDGRVIPAAGPAARIEVEGRVPAALAKKQAGGYRTVTAVPRPTWPIGPGLLAALLGVGAAAALAGAGALLWPDARRRLLARAAPPGDTDPFRRSLRLLRESAQRPGPDRRRAAGLVARLAGERGGDEVAGGATRLAWGRPEPAPEAALALADEAEQGVPAAAAEEPEPPA